jgi:hypothetical protein
METKQTAIEWLIQQKKNHKLGLITKEDLIKAKQMEKEQIMKAYTNGSPEFFDMSEEYYNETYGNG